VCLSGANQGRIDKAGLARMSKFRIDKPASLSPLQAAVLRKEQTLKEAKEAFMINIVFWALEKAKGNQTEAAKILGITRTSIVEILRRRNLSPCQKWGRKFKSAKRTQELLLESIASKKGGK
jgi:DNA-binding NtrC family response regulator